jgi:hypothetical protein
VAICLQFGRARAACDADDICRRGAAINKLEKVDFG